MECVTKKAYGKVNLFLSVGELRSDGKHEVETVLHKTGIFDTVTVTKNEKNGITVTCDVPGLPLGRENLAYRACEEYGKRAGVAVSVSVDIRKRIPITGGMGGGSSDCAAVLLALNEIYEALDFEELVDIAASLGSDVPFFMYDARAGVGVGSGERITPCASLSTEVYALFLFGGHKESTGAMYARLDERKREMKLSGCVSSSESIVSALENGNVHDLMNGIMNDFEICYDDLDEIKRELSALGAEKTFLCGSGPTVCALFVDKEKAKNAALGVKRRTFLTKIE